MNRQAALAWGSIAGGVLAVLVNVPPGWYGVPTTGAYLFDPPVLSPLWASRELVPPLSVVAVIGLLSGVGGLASRDWAAAGRARRLGLGGTAVGLAGLAVAVGAFGYAGEGQDVLLTLLGLAVGAVGVLLLVPSLLLVAYGYARTDRPAIGYAFAFAVVAVPYVSYVDPPGVGALLATLPVGVTWAGVGAELLAHPDPVDRSDEG